MRFQDIRLCSFEFNDDHSGILEVPATEELLNVANDLRKYWGQTDLPSESNDIYYTFYIVFFSDRDRVELNFTTANSCRDDYVNYNIPLSSKEEKSIAFKIIQYLAEESIK